MARHHNPDRDDRRRLPGAPMPPEGCAPTGPEEGAARGLVPAAEALPEAFRGPASLLLGLYVVGLVLCVAGNTASGTSLLIGTVKDRLFAPWMVPLWLDLGHDTRLTYGLPEDADHHLEIRLAGQLAGKQAGKGMGQPTAALRLPAQGDHSERATRWRRLAAAAVLAEEDAEQAGVLPAAIGAGAFAAAGADDLEIRVVRSVPPDYASARSPRITETALEVRVRRRDGEVHLIPMPPAEEVAPLIDAASAPGGGN